MRRTIDPSSPPPRVGTGRTTVWSMVAAILFATGILAPGGPPSPLRDMALRMAAAQGYNPYPDPRSGIDDHHYLGGSGTNVGEFAGMAHDTFREAIPADSPQLDAYQSALTVEALSPERRRIRGLLSEGLRERLKPGLVPDAKTRRRLNVELNRLILRGGLRRRPGR